MTRLLSRILLLSALVCSLNSLAQAQTYTYNFDAGIPDLAANFDTHDPFTSYTPTGAYLATGGLGNTGALRGPGTFSHAAVYRTAFPNQPGVTATISMFFVGNTTFGTSPGDFIKLGIADSLSASFRTSASYNFLATTVGRSDNSGTLQGSPTSLFLPDNWYKLTTTYQNNGSTWTTSSFIEDYGQTGTDAPTLFASRSPSSTSNVFVGSDVYAMINLGTLGGSVSGARAGDNFQLTVTGVTASAPEPGTLSLLALGVLGGLVCRQQRYREA